jgi:hypothetical protein
MCDIFGCLSIIGQLCLSSVSLAALLLISYLSLSKLSPYLPPLKSLAPISLSKFLIAAPPLDYSRSISPLKSFAFGDLAVKVFHVFSAGGYYLNRPYDSYCLLKSLN